MCTGCVACGYDGQCVQKDGMEQIRESHYCTLVKYLNLQDVGMILGEGCGSPAMTKNTEYPKMAYELGKNC